MEGVHKSSSRNWISNQIKVNDMLTEALNGSLLHSCFDPQLNLEQDLKDTMSGVSFDFEAVEKSCSFDNLNCDLEGKVELNKMFEIPPDVYLRTLGLQKQDVDERLRNPAYGMMVCNDMKNIAYPENKALVRSSEESTVDVIELPEVILTVRIYHPVAYTGKSFQQTKLMLNQEFFVTGHQVLTQLRDVIICTSELASPGDFSENPDAPFTRTFKDMYKSGFFYIDGVFYNDMRSPDCKDYSKVLLDWTEKKANGIGPFTAKLMEETQFIDISIQLGYPYVYCHQGDCEHLVIFSDLRLMTNDDCLDPQLYPMVSRYISKLRTVCSICQMLNVSWIVTGDRMVPEKPSLLCDCCLKTFHYTKDGQKMGKFEARSYVDRSVIV